MDSPDAEWRGIVFRFDRKDYLESIASMCKRVILFDAFIDSDHNPADFKVGDWSVVNGKLKQTVVEKEKAKK